MNAVVHEGDCREVMRGMEPGSVHCCVTSPPYWGLRDYGHEGQLGLEETVEAYVATMVGVFREVRRLLRDDGTLWLNLGDSYAGSWAGNLMRPGGGSQREGGPGFQPLDDRVPERSGAVPDGLKPKDLVGVPWRVAFALQADGWYLRQDIIWHKPNPMPESVRDRCTKAHEYVFLLSKSERYYYDADAIKEPSVDPAGSAKRYQTPFTGAAGNVVCPGDPEGQRYRPSGMREFAGNRNKRSVWNVTLRPFGGAHFAVFPPALIEPCVLAGCPEDGTVLDPFAGSGTTGIVARHHGRRFVGAELNPEYAAMARDRIAREAPPTLFDAEGGAA